MQEYIEIGKLNLQIFKEMNIKLITDKVIFTVERMAHVENKRPNLYEQVKVILPQVIYYPDYIYKDWNNRGDTFVFIKNIDKISKINVIIKVATLNDKKHNKNSIITMIKVGNKTFKKIQKNKRENLLYQAGQKSINIV